MCERVCGDVLNLFFKQGIANQDGARGGNTSKPCVRGLCFAHCYQYENLLSQS